MPTITNKPLKKLIQDIKIIMKITAISAIVLASLASSAYAAGGSNTITFNGEVVENTCKVDTGDITVKLPTVIASQIADTADGAVTGAVGLTNFAVQFNCAGDTMATAQISFQPRQGTTTGELLKNTAETDAAENVGIALFDASNNAQILLNKAPNLTKDSPTGAGQFILAAGYVLTGEAETKPGKVNAELPFIVSYK